MTTKDLLTLAEAYAQHHGLTLSTVGTYAANAGVFFTAIRDGDAGCTLRKAANVMAWFDSRWPADLAWPRGIERPSKTKDAA